MENINKKIEIGDNVKIIQKDGKENQGMVRSVLRDFNGEVIVELFSGVTGRVIKLMPRKQIITIKKTPNTQLKRIPLRRVLVPKIDIFSGEKNNLEYKLNALWSQDLTNEEIEKNNTPELKKYGNRASKVIIAKVIAGFLNTSGGDLIIGIKEEKSQSKENEIVGIDEEFKKLKNKDYGEDGYRRMIMDDIIRTYFPKEIFNHFNSYFQISFPKKDGKILCRISIKKSESEVFITIANNDHFFIRVDTQTRELKGKEIIDYIRTHFK